MTIALVVEVALCILLFAVLIYAVILNRHLSILRGSHQDIQSLMSLFDQAIQKANQSLGNIKQSATLIATQTEEKVKKANTMCQELEFLIGRSEILVSELESLVIKAEQADANILPLPERHGERHSFASELQRKTEAQISTPQIHALPAIQKLR